MSNPTELPDLDKQYTEWCERHDLPEHQSREAFDDATSLHLLRAQPEGEAPQAEQEQTPNLEDCPEDDQQWEKIDPAVAFHLIERHAEDWADAGRMMLQWHKAISRAAQLDGGQEGSGS